MRLYLLRFGRACWRVLLWLALLMLLLMVSLLAVLGSEGGSRWLLEQGLGMQKVLTARYLSGTFLSGLELREVRLHTSKIDLQIGHLLARWSLLRLLRAEIELQQLQAEGIGVHLLTPPTGKPTKLPLLVIPVRLVITDASITDVRLFNYGASRPLTLSSLQLAGAWSGSKVELARLQAEQTQLGTLFLKGQVSLKGGYPLFAFGHFDYRAFREKGWQPLALTLRREVADLDIELSSQGGLTAEARARIRPLEPSLPYSANMEWQAVTLPWLESQALSSKAGKLHVSGDKTGLAALGEAQLAGRHLPPGQYAVKGRTNWKSAHIDSLNFNGLMGKVKASGDVSWRQGLSWDLVSDFQQLDLARQWPVPRYAVPVMTGRLESKGHTSEVASELGASLRLNSGEHWSLQQQGQSWFWNLKAPQTLQMRWQQVGRVVPGMDSISSESGELELRGTTEDYSLLLDAGLTGSKLPAGRWHGELSGARRHVSVEHLAYEGEAGAVTLAGELELDKIIRWEGALVLSDASTGWLLPDWSGQFTGHVTGRGEWGPARRVIDIGDAYVHGSLREQAFLLDGLLRLSLPVSAWPQGGTSGLHIAWGVDKVDLKGGLDDAGWNVQADLQLQDLSMLDAGLRGSVTGTVGLLGEERRPDVVADIKAADAGTSALRLRNASLQMRLAALGEKESALSFLADGLINSAGRDFGQLGLEVSGTQAAHKLQWQAGYERIHGQGSLSGRFLPESLGWQGQMDTGQVSLPEMDWLLSNAASLMLDGRRKQLEVGEHCWISLEARLCNTGTMRVGEAGSVQLALTGLAASRLASLLPEGLALSGDISGRADGEWQPGQRPRLTASLAAENGAVELARDDSAPPLQLPYQKVALALDAAESVGLRFELASESLGQGQIQASIDPYADNRPLAGSLALNGLRLDVFQPFFPGLSALAGNVAVNGRLQGTLAKPEFWGDVQLDDGTLGLHRLPVNLHGISLKADVRGHEADLDGRAMSGEGLARLSGHADWATEKPVLDLAIRGERFQIKQEPQLLAEISPDLKLHIEPGQMDLTGQILVPTGRLNLKPLTDKAIPLSSDVRIVTSAEGEQVQGAVAVSQWLINADVMVRLGDDVYFHGYGVNGRLIGALRLRQQGRRALEANGEVELDKDSRYDAYGQRLLIRRGRLIFAGNLTQPGLDVEAVREVDSQIVGVRVEGRANSPEVSFFSDGGGLSQEEILSYLVLGRPLDTSSGREGPNLSAAAAAIKLGATGGAGLTNRVGDSLGITDLAVDAEGNGDDTQFTVSGYLSPKLYLRYGVGIFTPVNTATIRYKINARVYLEAVSSLDSAIDLFYNLKF